MPFRLEIRLKHELTDAEGAGIRRNAREYFGFGVDDIRVIRVLTIDAQLNADQLARIQTEIFTNPVTEISSYAPMAHDFDWLIWIGLRPGVRDTAGSTAREAVEDLLGVPFKSGEAVYTSKLYELRGDLKEQQVRRIAGDLLANEVIQQWKIFSRNDWRPEEGIGFPVPKVMLDHSPEVNTLSIDSDEELKRISLERNLALQTRDIPVIRSYFMREDIRNERKKFGLDLPTDVELEYIPGPQRSLQPQHLQGPFQIPRPLHR